MENYKTIIFGDILIYRDHRFLLSNLILLFSKMFSIVVNGSGCQWGWTLCTRCKANSDVSQRLQIRFVPRVGAQHIYIFRLDFRFIRFRLKWKFILRKINCVFEHRPKVSDGVDFPFTLDGLDRLVHEQNYNRTFRTVFYVHGLNGERNGSDIKTIHDAYKMRKGFNLILFFWAGPSSDFYPKAVINGVAVNAIFPAFVKWN